MTGVQRLLEAGLIISGAISIFLFTALLTFHPADPGWSQAAHTQDIQNAAGAIGARFADVLLFTFGLMAYVIPFLVMLAGYFAFYRARTLIEIDYLTLGLRIIGVILFVAGCSSLFSLNLDGIYNFSSGGILGRVISSAMVPYFNVPGTILLLLTFVLTGITLVTGLSWLKLVDTIGAWAIQSTMWVFNVLKPSKTKVPAVAASTPMPAPTQPKLKAAEKAKDPTKESAKIKTKSWWNKLKFWQRSPKTAAANDWDSLPVTDTRLTPSRAGRQAMAESDDNLPSISTTAHAEPEEIVLQGVSAINDEPNVDDLPWDTGHTATTATMMPSAAAESASINAEPAAPARVDPLPSLALLDRPNQQENPLNQEELDEISRTVETVLKDFGIDVQVVGVQPGPVITRFELDLAPGVKVSRITNLSKDIARSLSAIAVRVVEVIPGKSFVGLELPNKNREIVQLHEVLSCENFINSTSPLTMVLGKDIAGKPVVVDLGRMPHLLVAGTTGSGKSVGVNAMIISLLYKSQPEDVRLIMIDPKMLELSVYEGIPHLLTEVVTDMKDAANALRWCVGEMERRYRVMSALGVRNIKGYNDKVAEAIAAGKPLKNPVWKPGDSMDATAPDLEKLPYIVVVVDEFADMMMIVGKKVEELIARIAQKARAAGIHLILATQRPSVDVITGLIKANIPTRIAFQVSSKIDSRTILDQPGADQLLGQGDMLYLPPGSGVPTRVHGAFVDDHEVHAVVADWKARSKPQYLEEILSGDANEDMLLPGEQSEEDAESDPLYDEAVAFVTEKGRVSISSVQRQFRIGYNRAARIVEQMEVSGVVSTAGPGGARDVLAPRAPRHPSIDY
ncbi:DNA translocase FtsK [Aliidiomarina quisquiliarum]|uniref:DNA translocase FtsK n=1 Tax=Aliidiomarina quisquiliarum TaxID=2938947 RepID=UPI00208EC98C|nr:DNA translocase FtsK [Aliidiomarina quisquiliarum]MCO4320789.1 DNA translocase FtsK 4TM domain-containing protein [Aliidiomarina quisquiliarum]